MHVAINDTSYTAVVLVCYDIGKANFILMWNYTQLGEKITRKVSDTVFNSSHR